MGKSGKQWNKKKDSRQVLMVSFVWNMFCYNGQPIFTCVCAETKRAENMAGVIICRHNRNCATIKSSVSNIWLICYNFSCSAICCCFFRISLRLFLLLSFCNAVTHFAQCLSRFLLCTHSHISDVIGLQLLSLSHAFSYRIMAIFTNFRMQCSDCNESYRFLVHYH